MRTRSLAVLIPAALAVALLPALPAAARLGPSWVPGPDLLPRNSTGAEFKGVSASSATDIWAVGVVRTTTDNPLAANYNGKGWTVTPTPAAPGGNRYNLLAVDAVQRADAWAVGSYAASPTAAFRTAAVLHYDGAWTADPLPIQPIGVGSELTDVDMSATGGWAVGWLKSGAKVRALVLRRTGGIWSPVGIPDADASNTELSAVFARNDNDVWVAGSQVRLDGRRIAMTMHWDGTGWLEHRVPVVSEADEETFLAGISSSEPGDVWAAGRMCREIHQLETCRPLAVRFTGSEWTVVPTNGEETELTEIIAFSPSDVWAIGYTGDTPLLETDYAEHWDGTVFTPDASGPPDPDGPIANGEPASALSSATAIPGTGGIWAVGWARDPIRGAAHVVHRD